jgi:excisionase family DNA binding protein
MSGGNGATDFMPIPEIAERLDLSVVRVYQLINKGDIPAVRIAGRVRVPRRAFEQWMDILVEDALRSVEKP